jgi:hypothetical protein
MATGTMRLLRAERTEPGSSFESFGQSCKNNFLTTPYVSDTRLNLHPFLQCVDNFKGCLSRGRFRSFDDSIRAWDLDARSTAAVGGDGGTTGVPFRGPRYPSLTIGPLLDSHRHDMAAILRESLATEDEALQLYRQSAATGRWKVGRTRRVRTPDDLYRRIACR